MGVPAGLAVLAAAPADPAGVVAGMGANGSCVTLPSFQANHRRDAAGGIDL